jgi:acyl-CoA thioesterase I
LSQNRIIMLRLILACLVLLGLSACAEPVPQDDSANILVLGDSMFATNRLTGAGVGDVIEAELARPVIDRSVPGARYFHRLPLTSGAGLRLTKQYQPGNWDVVVLNGGGNDLLFGCGCGRCDGVLNRLIAEDGRSGAIPAFVKSLRDSGAFVVYAGYLRNPGTFTPIRACRTAGDELDRRLRMLDALDEGMVFLPMADLVPFGDGSYHGPDGVHPSAKGSREIALRIVQAIQTRAEQ